jgi:hypothetical protein
MEFDWGLANIVAFRVDKVPTTRRNAWPAWRHPPSVYPPQVDGTWQESRPRSPGQALLCHFHRTAATL